MKCIVTGFLLMLLCSTLGFCDDCAKQKAQFSELNLPLIIRSGADWSAYRVNEASWTDRIHGFVSEQILSELRQDTFVQPAKIVSLLNCVQSGISFYSRRSETTNVPQAIPLAPNAVAVAYEIYRGGEGAPSTRPFFDLYSAVTGEWKLVGDVGGSFTGFTFFVQPIGTGKPGERWFLLWGNRVGDSGARLRLSVVSYTGHILSEIWSSPERVHASVSKVTGDYVLVNTIGTSESGRGQDIQIRYDVVPEGLQSEEPQILKTY